MTVGDIHGILSAWAPRQIAWERDNVGLQVGDMKASVNGILVCLDVTPEVVAEAARRKANLIVNHHPLLFRPPKTITPGDEVGACITALIQKNIFLYSAHTNLDFTHGGTSHALADTLGLQNVEFLHRNYTPYRKIVTFVPEHNAATVRTAMAAAGAGRIGNYDECSFRVRGTGSFFASSSAAPAVGTRGRLEEVPEVRLEMIAEEWAVPGVLRALRAAHPYEEVAYDVYPMDNISNGYGMGIIGTLARPMRPKQFLNFLKTRLRVLALRHTALRRGNIRRVAACGGSGAELADSAVTSGADAFITADVKYHDFHHAAGRILLVDAGHYETEHPVVAKVVSRLKQEMEQRGSRIPVFPTRLSTNPVFYS